MALEQPQLNEHLSFVTEPSLAGREVDRLITVDDANAARLLMDRFPNVVESTVLETFAKWIGGQGTTVPSTGSMPFDRTTASRWPNGYSAV